MKRSCFCDGWEFSRDGGEFQPVVVPHDAMLGNRRGPEAPAQSASGYYYGATYRYRKTFELSETQAAGALLLEFEGVYRDASLIVNGAEIDVPPYGFIPFFADISGHVHAGENTIEVKCANDDQPDCRWYSGAGLHRPVWLWEGDKARILPEGVRVTTTSFDPAVIEVDVDCTEGNPHVRILDPRGKAVAEGEGRQVRFEIPDAHLWSATHPNLYTCVVELAVEGDDDVRVADTAECAFGIRKLEWGPKGLFVNGRETLLRGGCIHCDHGILGAASWPESEYRRISIMKQAGFNAVRIAHNPAPTALLDACDELGMYVMDETWDMWYTRKSAHDYSRHFLHWCDHDLRRLVTHDYNHPSVIMYSIGNEIADPVKRLGVDLENSFVELLHSIDPTRPVTCGLNLAMMVMERIGSSWYDNADGVADPASTTGAPRGSMLFNLTAQALGTGMTMFVNAPGADRMVSPALDALDIAGYNYATSRYAIDARKHPKRIIVGSETFPHELAQNWEKVKRLPNVIGDFMWTGWDYLGEAGAGSWTYTAEEAGFSKPWPWLLAGSGALDIFGNPNAHAALAGAVWRTADAPSIQVRPVNHMGERTYKATWRGSDAIPCWSWAGCEGTTAQVEVYDGRAFSVRLELNGDVVGQKNMHDCVAKFQVEYLPGTLVAIGLDKQGRELSRSSLSSARTPFHLSVKPELARFEAGGIAYVEITTEGANGVVEANVDERLAIRVEGGDLLAFGSAQPAPTESFLSGTYTTYRGRAMAVVHRADAGTARVSVKGETLAAASAEVVFA